MLDAFNGRRVLVTGGCGFIGSNLVHRLVKLGARVTVVDDLVPHCGGRLENLHRVRDRMIFRRFDLSGAAEHPDVFRDAELVFCVAGATSHVHSMRNPQADLQHNLKAPLAVLEALRRENPQARVVATSTRQVYGRPLELPVTESHPLAPVDINGIHMQAAESYYRLYHGVYGVRSVCLRLTNTYGPRMHLPRGCHGLSGVFVRQALRGEPIMLFGGGEHRRDFLFVDDVVDALLAAACLEPATHEVYNVGHCQPHSIREFAEVLCELVGGSPVAVEFPPERLPIDIGDYWGSSEKFRRATGWQPKTSLRRGIEKTVRYYLAHPHEYGEASGSASARRLTANLPALNAMEGST